LFAVTNAEIVVQWDKKNMKILDINGQLIAEVPELDEDERISWNLASCCLSGDQMAVLSQTDGQQKLSVWDVSDPLTTILLKTKCSNHDMQPEMESLIKMDDQFIAISTFHSETTRFDFFSKKTLDQLWQKTVDGNMKKNFAYGQGILLLYKTLSDSEEFAVIEMYGVESGQYLRKIRTPARCHGTPLECLVGFNSNFMVIANLRFFKTNMDVYHLEAVKNSKAKRILPRTLAVKNCYKCITVSETEILCMGYSEIDRLDFGSFECFRNAAKSVTLSLPWRSVWRSKGVDEEPLEPGRHMEVYREVLKYFEKLSMNCRTAIKTYYMYNGYPATFTYSDDFIGSWPHEREVVVYKGNKRKTQKMNYKTVQISESRYVSVFMGNVIQLINRKSGKVISKVKLERDVIGWHFNCNLLVCVHKIADREHLLSVWRVDNSSYLKHIKEVVVEDYDGALQVDEMFMAVKSESKANAGTKTYNFISMNTFQVERSVSSRAKYFEYDKGYLFLQKDDHLVRILDVASGKFLRDIRMEPFPIPLKICSINSNYVVLLTENEYHSKLYVYDLKCLKETEAVPSHLLLTSIDVECDVRGMVMNEYQIVCIGDSDMYVVDLQPIHRLRCPESC
jgi:hypothetical protein